MVLSKLCLVTTLVLVVTFVAVQTFDAQTKEVDGLIANLRWSRPANASDELLQYTGPSSNKLVRPNLALHAKMENPSTGFLPVQSRNPNDLAAGKLLVASRALADPNFAETVILLVHCDAEGVVGLILNRRTDIPLARVLEQFESAKDRSDPAFLGGPVETPAVFALLRSAAKLDGAEQIVDGVYMISTKTAFEKTLSGRPEPDIFHVYLGYAGWSSDQLRKEVELGSWFIFQGDARTVFDSDPHSLWRQMIQKTELKLAGSDPHTLERF